jgi:hypothetical protein
MTEWEQLKPTTAKEIAVRGSIGLVESSSTANELSSTRSESDSTAGVRAA